MSALLAGCVTTAAAPTVVPDQRVFAGRVPAGCIDRLSGFGAEVRAGLGQYGPAGLVEATSQETAQAEARLFVAEQQRIEERASALAAGCDPGHVTMAALDWVVDADAPGSAALAAQGVMIARLADEIEVSSPGSLEIAARPSPRSVGSCRAVGEELWGVHAAVLDEIDDLADPALLGLLGTGPSAPRLVATDAAAALQRLEARFGELGCSALEVADAVLDEAGGYRPGGAVGWIYFARAIDAVMADVSRDQVPTDLGPAKPEQSPAE